MGIRRKARENALKILYACEIGRYPVEETIQAYWHYWGSKDEDRGFAEQIVHGAIKHKEEFDSLIQQNSDHWKINRMTCIDRNILRMAAYELFYIKEVPKRITLNEAIEIAKQYGTEDSWAFINGILDKLAEEIS